MKQIQIFRAKLTFNYHSMEHGCRVEQKQFQQFVSKSPDTAVKDAHTWAKHYFENVVVNGLMKDDYIEPELGSLHVTHQYILAMPEDGRIVNPTSFDFFEWKQDFPADLQHYVNTFKYPLPEKKTKGRYKKFDAEKQADIKDHYMQKEYPNGKPVTLASTARQFKTSPTTVNLIVEGRY